MTVTQKNIFLGYVTQKKSVFAKNLGELGCCNTTTCEIELKAGTELIYIHPYKNTCSGHAGTM